MIETWKRWIEAFDRAYETGDWSEASEFLTEDVVYVVAGVPFACELRGRGEVLSGFRKSLKNFDKRFDTRRWEAVDIKVWSDHAVTALAKGDYEKFGKVPITFAAKSAWFFRGNQISLMTDIYDVTEYNAAQTLNWLADNGEGIDARYV